MLFQGIQEAAENLRNSVGKKLQCVAKNMLSGWFCNNARTSDFHQESDSSYTAICVPFFDDELLKELDSFKFQFSWNRSNSFAHGFDVLLEPGCVLYYNGRLIFHRQVPIEVNQLQPVQVLPKKEYRFLNLSMYHNEKLRNHILLSLKR